MEKFNLKKKVYKTFGDSNRYYLEKDIKKFIKEIKLIIKINPTNTFKDAINVCKEIDKLTGYKLK